MLASTASVASPRIHQINARPASGSAHQSPKSSAGRGLSYGLSGCGIGGDRLHWLGPDIRGVRRIGVYLQPLGAVVLLLAGGYVIYYWLTIGGIGSALG